MGVFQVALHLPSYDAGGGIVLLEGGRDSLTISLSHTRCLSIDEPAPTRFVSSLSLANTFDPFWMQGEASFFLKADATMIKDSEYAFCFQVTQPPQPSSSLLSSPEFSDTQVYAPSMPPTFNPQRLLNSGVWGPG